MALLLTTGLLATPAVAAKGPRIDRDKYARIAAAKCAIAKPNALEPSQESGEMRPMVLYFVASNPREPKLAFICLDSDVVPRAGVQISFTAFNRRGVVPVFYGDNSRRCPSAGPAEKLPECLGNRFITGGLTLSPVVPPVVIEDNAKGYGTMATVFTLFSGPTGGARQRYYRVPIETIPIQ